MAAVVVVTVALVATIAVVVIVFISFNMALYQIFVCIKSKNYCYQI